MAKKTKKGAGWIPPTDEAVLKASTDLIELVEASLPQRFYRGEHPWKWMGAAFIVRMTDTVESMVVLMKAGRATDGQVLLRSLYEQVVIYCWASIDRETNPERWRLNGLYWLRKLHTDAIPYSQKVLTQHELAKAEKGVQMPPVMEQAAEVDRYWGGRLVGFRPPTPGDMLTMRGLYVAIYRMGSRAAHAEATALNPYIDYDYPRRVHRSERDRDSPWWSLAVPLYAQALLVCNEQLKWPDPKQVKAINNAMYAQT
jgi:uncharacterized protein DUF5677